MGDDSDLEDGEETQTMLEADLLRVQIACRGYTVHGNKHGFLWWRRWHVTAIGEAEPGKHSTIMAHSTSDRNLTQALRKLLDSLPKYGGLT